MQNKELIYPRLCTA